MNNDSNEKQMLTPVLVSGAIFKTTMSVIDELISLLNGTPALFLSGSSVNTIIDLDEFEQMEKDEDMTESFHAILDGAGIHAYEENKNLYTYLELYF